MGIASVVSFSGYGPEEEAEEEEGVDDDDLTQGIAIFSVTGNEPNFRHLFFSHL